MLCWRCIAALIVVALVTGFTHAWAREEKALFAEPFRITSHPAEDYMPTVSPDGRQLVFVSNRAGAPNLWIKSVGDPSLPTPKQLTHQAAGDKDPAYSPDGKKIVYTSYGSDAEGDIYVLTLPKPEEIVTGVAPDIERLTGMETADREPVFTADGEGVIFSSRQKTGNQNTRLVRYDIKTKEIRRISEGGGRQASVSPDGNKIVFAGWGNGAVGERGGLDNSSLIILDLNTGQKTRLLETSSIDSFPTFDGDDAVIFVRYESDTNGDGVVTIDDNPALMRKSLKNIGLPPYRLTTFEDYNLFPETAGSKLYYSAQTEKGVDIFAIPVSGIFSPSIDPEKDFEKAKKAVLFYTKRSGMRRLSWDVFSAAHAKCDKCKQQLAESLYLLGKEEEELKEIALSRRRYQEVINLYPASSPWAGFSEIELAAIDSDGQRLIENLEKIKQKYVGVKRVEAKADIFIARALVALRKPEEALLILRRAVTLYEKQKKEAAQAAFERNRVYLLTGERDKMIDVYLDVVRSYPGQEEWVARAVEEILDLAIVENDTKATALAYDQIISRDDSPEVLRAAAMNRTAALYWEADDPARARKVYQLTVDRYPMQRREKTEALFSIAQILTTQERYSQALKIYRKIERDTDNKREVYLAAQRSFIAQSIKKAEYEQKSGDIRLALKTYYTLAEYDPSITEAHRGIIRLKASLGNTEEVIAEYEKRLSEKPEDDLLMYSLGLALTYRTPLLLDRPEKLILAAIHKDEVNPWYHQSLGWVYEQRERETQDGSYALMALERYLHALALTDSDKNPEREADLRLNLGNVSYTLKNCATAVENYGRRQKLGFPFEDSGAASWFYQRWGECQFLQGDDRGAIHLFELSRERAGSDPYRLIELHERTALAYQSSGMHKEAAERFRQSLKLRRSVGLLNDEEMIVRNIANNLYFESEKAPAGKKEALMREALGFYLESEEKLTHKRRIKKKKGSGALVNVNVKTGAGGIQGSSSGGFSITEEKKLLFHHIGKIYGELGDHKKAAEYFEKKLELVPAALALLGNAPVLTEKSIILNQLGVYLSRSGDEENASRRFIESLAICEELSSATCIVKNVDNMARTALKKPERLSPETFDSVIDKGGQALLKLEVEAPEAVIATASALNRYGQLYHERFKKKEETTVTGSVEEVAELIKGAAEDANLAGKFYEKSLDLFNGVQTADGLASSLRTKINMAALLADLGKHEEASSLFEKIITGGENKLISDIAFFDKVNSYGGFLHSAPDSEQVEMAYDQGVKYAVERTGESGVKPLLPGPVWEAYVTRYLYYPDAPDSINWLKTARRIVMMIPFGYQLGDNREYKFALVTALYQGLLKNSTPSMKVSLRLEKDAVVRRFILGDILRRQITEESLPGIDALRDVYHKYRLVRELMVAGAEDGVERYAKLRLDEARVINSLFASNRLLLKTAYSSLRIPKYLAESQDYKEPLDYLEGAEAALIVFREGDLSYAVYSKNERTGRFFTTRPDLDKELVEYLEGKGYTRLYLVTDRPFSGQPLPLLFLDRFAITTVPSVAMIPHIKMAQNINDYRLVASDSDKTAIGKVADSFLDVSLPSETEGGESEKSPLAAAGVLLFDAISDDGNELNSVRFKIGEASVSATRLLAARHEGSLLISPPPATGYMEGALYNMALLSGYPSWLVLSEEKVKRVSFLKAYLAAMRETSAGEALTIARAETRATATLAGAFGLSANQRKEFAAKGFEKEVQTAIAAVKGKSWGKAADAFERAHIFTLITGERRYDALLFNWMAEAFFQMKRFDEAIFYQEKLLAIYRKAGKKVKLAKSLLVSGAIYTKLGKYDEAVADIGEALEIYREVGEPDSIIEASSQLGAAEEGYKRYDRALTAFGAALDTSREAGSAVKSADSLRRVGRIYHLRLNRFDRAREAFGKSISLYESEGNEKKAISVMIDLASTDIDAGALDAAEETLADALSRAENIADEKLIALVMFHLSNVAWFRGDYTLSLERVERSIGLAEERDAKHELAMSYSTKGLVYWTLNDYPKATEALERSLNIARAVGARLDEASALNNLGLVYRSAGRLLEAKKSFEAALFIDQKLKSDWAIAYDARNLSIVLQMMGDIPEAEKMAEKAVFLTKKTGDRINGAKALLQLANIKAAKKKWEETLSKAFEARDVAQKAGIKEVVWRTYRIEGRALYSLGKKEGAIKAYMQGVKIVEKLRASIRRESLRQGFLDDKQDIYEELILLLIEQKRVNEAFNYAERSRARGFIDLLGKSPPKLKTKADTKEFERIRRLRLRVDELSKAGEAAKSEREEAASKLFAAIEKVRKNRPDLLPFVSVSPVDAKGALKALDENTALLEYVVTEKATILFIAAAGRIKAHLLPVTKSALAKKVMDYRGAIQDGAPVSDTPKYLGKLLLGPAMKTIEKFPVIGIAPHGPLHYLSFAALETGGSWLIDKKPIFYVPSASVYIRTKARRSQNPPAMMSALAVGDPDLGSYDTELPLAQLEAKSLKWIFPKVTTLTGKEATETSVSGKANEYHVVHIASHALYDPVSPLDSALYLAADQKKDGAFMAKEIFSMNIGADLVTLSACQTGLGEVTRGDEVVGLNRAFFYAGAHTIVSTLWRVDDMASAILVKRFYRNLLESEKAEALRKAQLSVKKRFPHPSFWAGFTLVGDYR